MSSWTHVDQQALAQLWTSRRLRFRALRSSQGKAMVRWAGILFNAQSAICRTPAARASGCTSAASTTGSGTCALGVAGLSPLGQVSPPMRAEARVTPVRREQPRAPLRSGRQRETQAERCLHGYLASRTWTPCTGAGLLAALAARVRIATWRAVRANDSSPPPRLLGCGCSDCLWDSFSWSCTSLCALSCNCFVVPLQHGPPSRANRV